jgi:23S rRNA (adenine2503-C2)-methyltransferase
MPKPDLRAMTVTELEALMAGLNQPAYRALQLFTQIHGKYAASFDEMTDLPRSLRAALGQAYALSPLTPVRKVFSNTDHSCKYLFVTGDNTIMESVLMAHKHGNSLCVSTQAGCRMGCVFCASGVKGLTRNLTAGEICAQVYAVGRDTGKPIHSVLLMGCGEPLDNFANTLRFLSLINHPKGFGLGYRGVTVSTCGLVPQIRKLAESRLPVTLAVSLHAANDALRRTLMPVARTYTLAQTLAAGDYYAETARRRVTYEYALAKGVNDSVNDARALAGLLKGKRCHVNLLPLNPVSRAFTPSNETYNFSAVLKRHGIPVTARRSMGGDIGAACGQLRGEYMD